MPYCDLDCNVCLGEHCLGACRIQCDISINGALVACALRAIWANYSSILTETQDRTRRRYDSVGLCRLILRAIKPLAG